MSSKAEKTRTKKSQSDKSLAISGFAKQFERKAHINALKAAQDLVEREIDCDKEIMGNQISQLRKKQHQETENEPYQRQIKPKSVTWNQIFSNTISKACVVSSSKKD